MDRWRADAGHDGVTAFVLAHEPGLLRTAVLLTGDRGSAQDLVLAALSRAARRWDRVRRAGDPLGAVRRLLLGAHLGRRSRPWSGPQVLEEWPGPDGDGRPGVDELWQALDLLAPRVRAVLVLRFAADLSEAATADLLGCPAGVVRDEAAEGARAVRRALAASHTVAADPDDDVRDALDLLAVRAGPPGGEETAAAARALARRRRRTAACWGAAAVAVAVAVAVAGAAVPALLPDVAPVAEQTVRTEQAARTLYDAPPRGSLAADEDFLDGVAALDWSAPLGLDGAELAPPEDSRRVLFAGDLPGDRRWVLVAGEDEGQGLFAWFGGPAGAAPADLTPLSPPERFARRSTVSLLDTTGAVPLLVVVAPPEDRARYSPGTVRTDDGAVTRVWTELPVVDGVLVAEVDLPVYPGAEVVELARDGLRPTQLEFLPRTAGSTAPDWPFVQPLDVRLGTDRAAQARFTACLPDGFTARFPGDGAVDLTYPVVDGRRSDVELAMVYADWDATLAGCSARALGGG